MEKLFGDKITTCTEKMAKIKEKKEKEMKVRHSLNEPALIDSLKLYFDSNQESTAQFDTVNYSEDFLTELKKFVEGLGYVFNTHKERNPLFEDGQKIRVRGCISFIISTGVI